MEIYFAESVDLSYENEIMSYSLFCQPLNPLKGTWLIANMLRCSQPKPLQGFTSLSGRQGVKKYDIKYFPELNYYEYRDC